MQQQEAADARLLQQQLQQAQQQQQHQQHLQKQIATQKDLELHDIEQDIKELKARSDRVEEEFLSLVKDVVSQMQEKLSFKSAQDENAIAGFSKQMENLKNEMIASIDAFFTVKKETQTLGGAWRGLGLAPPSAVTKLGV
ncbi:hypothetical protein Efla_007710 [Eimeria flavescens]